jgi:hypothetical protein
MCQLYSVKGTSPPRLYLATYWAAFMNRRGLVYRLVDFEDCSDPVGKL